MAKLVPAQDEQRGFAAEFAKDEQEQLAGVRIEYAGLIRKVAAGQAVEQDRQKVRELGRLLEFRGPDIDKHVATVQKHAEHLRRADDFETRAAELPKLTEQINELYRRMGELEREARRLDEQRQPLSALASSASGDRTEAAKIQRRWAWLLVERG